MMDSETKNEYIIEQQNRIKLISQSYPHLLPLHPNLGYYVEISGIKISQELFPEEFKIITNNFAKVLAKISKLETDES
jgi:hypothetical protein